MWEDKSISEARRMSKLVRNCEVLSLKKIPAYTTAGRLSASFVEAQKSPVSVQESEVSIERSETPRVSVKVSRRPTLSLERKVSTYLLEERLSQYSLKESEAKPTPLTMSNSECEFKEFRSRVLSLKRQ